MSRVLTGVLAGCLVLALAGVAGAGIPDPDQSSVALTAPAGMCSCPLGDGPAYRYITVTAKRADSSPIEGIGASNFFFTVTGGSVTIDAVDAQTDVNGEIRFEIVADETIVLLDPEYLTVECQVYTIVLNDSENLEVNSVDIDESGTVGLSDFAIFSADYGTSAKRSDFDFSGTVGLSDFAIFSAHYGH
jgi:hypothetical protein